MWIVMKIPKLFEEINQFLRNKLGNFYFNVLKVQCIKEERPVICMEIRLNLILI